MRNHASSRNPIPSLVVGVALLSSLALAACGSSSDDTTGTTSYPDGPVY